jgi:hypothetical protein
MGLPPERDIQCKQLPIKLWAVELSYADAYDVVARHLRILRFLAVRQSGYIAHPAYTNRYLYPQINAILCQFCMIANFPSTRQCTPYNALNQLPVACACGAQADTEFLRFLMVAFSPFIVLYLAVFWQDVLAVMQ